MKTHYYKINDVVQLNPETCNPIFAACFFIITEVRTWGCQGYVQMTGINEKPGGQAFYRATWKEMGNPIGKAEWVLDREREINDLIEYNRS